MIRRSVLQLEATLNEMIDKLAESGRISFYICYILTHNYP